MGPAARQAAPSPDEVDARTVFVRDLPFTLTDAQLEEVFSEVGPVRHCFTVKDKGSEKNRGFGFVQFAVSEDAGRAVEAKNGVSLQGRKMKVELAKRRAPMDQRRPPKPKDESTGAEDSGPDAVQPESAQPEAAVLKKKRKASDIEGAASSESKGALQENAKKKKSEAPLQPSLKQPGPGKRSREDGKSSREVGKSSDKQRPARTTVIGGLTTPQMKDAVVAAVRKIHPTDILCTPLTEQELGSHGLSKDGCKPGAISIVFPSVRAARQAVAALHQQQIGGGIVWARQLGGEGSKLKKWRLIVRNLPFSVTESMLRELFTPAGFAWEISIPRKPDGKSRGFAFVGFTCKADAEKGISKVNMKTMEKRPIAVDWAVAKKNYESIAVAEPLGASGNETASTVPVDEEAQSASEEEEEVEEEPKVKKKRNLVDNLDKRIEPVITEGKETINLEPHDEVDMIRNVMKKVMSSNVAESVDPDGGDEGTDNKVGVKENVLTRKTKQDGKEVPPVSAENAADALRRTVFVRNLPPTVKVANMKNKFSVYGLVETFRLVYDKETKLPKGTAFMEFATVEAADGAVAASKEVGGINVGGQVLVLSIAVDREAAKNAGKPEGKTDGVVAGGKGSDNIERTVFIRNLPTEVNVSEVEDKFSVFGEVKAVRLVLHPITKRPRGTAFLEFGSAEAATAAEAAASNNENGPTGGIVIGGRAVKVNVAVGQQAARDIAVKLSKEETGDRRNLQLAQEGAIWEGTPAAEGVSKADILKRKQLQHEKATKLRSPNFHVSRTRLAAHNIPKTMSEKELKKMFIDAVLSRASKQKPVIKQVKILKDVTKAGDTKARGTAFVEFTEHQHALVALRALNNNPKVFGSEHRPIVEFAIESVKALRKREERVAAAKKSNSEKDVNKGRGPANPGPKRQLEERGTSAKEENVQGENGKGKKALKRKRQPTEAANSVKDTSSGGEMVPRSKRGPKGTDKKITSSSQTNVPTVPVESKPMDERVEKADGQGLPRKKPRIERQRNGSDVQQKHQKPSKPQKEPSRRERKQKTRGLRPGEDRLDQLVAEYRSKYFLSNQGQGKARGKTTGDDIRRWFE